MIVLNKLLELHEFTYSDWAHKKGKNGLSRRMFCRRFEISRIGAYEGREDIQPSMLLSSYLARKIYINERQRRGKFLLPEIYEKECQFTKGLWEIFCIEVFGNIMPELPVISTYDELEHIYENKKYYDAFDLYTTASDVVMHSIISNKLHITNHNEFDKECFMNNRRTNLHYYRKLHTDRKDPKLMLISYSMGMYKMDFLNYSEPYKNFWKEKAQEALLKMYVQFERTIITKFRNADVYHRTGKQTDKYPCIDNYIWNHKM